MSYTISAHGSIWKVQGSIEEYEEEYEAAGNIFPTKEAAEEELARRIAVWNEKYGQPNKQVSISFEVKAMDEPRKYTWHEAMEAFDNNPDSPCRLPTRTELVIMHENRERIGGFSDNRYWSSSESYGNGSWTQQFSDGAQTGYLKNYPFAVRLVRKEQQP